VLRAVRAGLIVAGGSAGSILGGPSNRSRTLVGGLSLVKKDRALELGSDLLIWDVDSGQKLSHYRGQIEPPASLPRGATVGCFGEVLSEEW